MLQPESSSVSLVAPAPDDAWTVARDQSRRAMISGFAASALATAGILLAPEPLATLAIDALQMAVFLTATVPPMILAGGWILRGASRKTRRRR